MSGIIGVVGVSNPKNMLNMSRAIVHRGVDGTAFWHDQNCSLGQLVLKNNRDSVVENAAVAQNKTVMVADAHIDSPHLNLLELYGQQGADMAQALIGDFAIAIWDSAKQQLFLIRDHSGVRPLFYVHKKGQFFAFASEPKALLALPEVSDILNQEKIGAYLMWQTDFRGYQNDTFYNEIFSVQPATTIVFDLKSDSFTETFYWKPDLGRFSHLKTDQDFVEAFRFYFTQSVERRTRSAYRIGAHLSGGLDSSSVSVVARDILAKKNQKLLTLHYDTQNSLSDEKPYAQSVIDTGGFEHLWVQKSQNFLPDLEKCQTILDKPDPFTVPLGLFRIGEAEFLQQNGARTLLTGHDGDTVVDSARFILDDLLKKRKIKEFKQLWSTYLSYKDGSTLYKDWENWNPTQRVRAMAPVKLKQLVADYLKQRNWQEALILCFLFVQEGLVSPFSFLKIAFDWAKKKVLKFKIPDLKASAINPVFLQSIDLKGYAEKQQQFRFLPANLTGQQLEHFKRVHCAGMMETNEVYNFFGAKYGFDVCHPFLDKDLIELCIATPPHLRYFGGKGRGQMRMAMAGLLPKDVLERTTKVEFSPVIRDNLLAIKPSITQKIKDCGVNKYIDIEAVDKLEKRLKETEYQSQLYSKPLQRALFLSEWLRVNQHE
jgi:asparagine synthase (glutamine-hydrolysing)